MHVGRFQAVCLLSEPRVAGPPTQAGGWSAPAVAFYGQDAGGRAANKGSPRLCGLVGEKVVLSGRREVSMLQSNCW